MGLESLPAWLRARVLGRRQKASQQKQRRAMFFEGLENRSLMAYDALNDSGVTNENTTLTVSNPASGLLSNDLGTPFAVTAFQATSAQGATVNVNANGTYTYNPTAAPLLQKMGAGETIVDTFTYTGRDNIFTTDGLMRVQLLASSGPTNNTANWLNVWNAVDAGATGGTIAGYTINDNRQDTETQFNYADAGNFGGTLGIDSINSNGPGGNGGFSGQTGDNYSIRAKTYLRFNTAGTYTIGLGSDDGRRISLTPAFAGTAPGYSGFTARGDQVNGSFNPGDTVIGYDGGTGHAWSVGTFTVAAGDVLRLDAFYYEGGGGDSGEIAIASGAQGTFGGAFALLTQGVQNIDLSSTGYTFDTATVNVTVNGVNEAPTPAVDNYATNENTAFTTSANPTFGMNVDVYDGTDNTIGSADTARNSSVTGLPINPPAATGTLALADLGTNGDGAFAGQSGVPAPGGGDSYAVFLTGWLKIDNTGNPSHQWTFGTFADDASRIRIDLNQNGVLEGSLTANTGETVAFLGGCCAATLGAPVTINDGYYKFEAVFTEGGGGDYGEFFYAPGNPGFSTTNYALLGNASKGISAVRVLPNGLFVNDTDEEIGLGNPTQAFVPTRVNGAVGLTGSSALGASVSVNLDGSFTYDPNVLGSAVQALGVGQTALDTFTYTVSDGDDNNPLETTQTVTITVTGLNDAPTAVTNNYTTNENTNLVNNDVDVAPRNNIGDSLDGNTNNDGVLVNDVDPDSGDTLEVSSVQGLPLTGNLGTVGDGNRTATTTLGGTVTMNDNGTFTYNPSTSTTLQQLGAGQSLVDSFTYMAKDARETFTPGMNVSIYKSGTIGGTFATADAARGSLTPAQTGSVTQLDFYGNNDSQHFPVNNVFSSIANNTENYAVYVVGTLRVSVGGLYTFGIHADDNARIRIDLDQDGILEGSLTGFGGTESGPNGGTVVAETGCCADRFGTVTLAPGDYDFEAMYTEGGGGDHGEFFFAPGNFTTFDTAFKLIGDPTGQILAGTLTRSQSTGTVSITVNGVNEAPVAVTDPQATNEDTAFTVTALPNTPGMNVAVYRGTNGGIGSIDAARAGAPSNTGTVLRADFPGDNSGINGGQGHFNNANPVPGGAGDNYGVLLTGILKVNTAGTYTFGTYSDDASRIRIDLNQNGVVATDGSEDIVTQPGCCADMFSGGITLAAGEYAFEAMYTEGGGGDYGEFFYAPGVFPGPAGFANLPFKIIGDGSGGIESYITRNHGLLGNDTDEEVDLGNPAQFLSVTAINGNAGLTGSSALGASVTALANGTFSYNPNVTGSLVQSLAAGQVASDTFTYTISDNDPVQPKTSTVTVTVTVTGRNDAPDAINNSYSTNEDTSIVTTDQDLPISGNQRDNLGNSTPGNTADDGVLVNDIEIDTNDVFEVVAVQGTALSGTKGVLNNGSATVSSTLGASVMMNDNGTFTYNPSVSATLRALNPTQTATDSFTYTVWDNRFLPNGIMGVQLAASSGPGNTTGNWLNVWNAIDAGTPPIGTVAGYSVTDYRQDTESTFNYADAGSYGGTLGVNSINSNGPGGAGGFGGQSADNYSIRTKTYLRFNTAGTYTLGLGSDDGRLIRMTPAFPGSAPGYSGFTAQGGQVNGTFVAGQTSFGFDGGTGHQWSVGTFTVAAGDLLFLDAFYYEGGGGDSGEIAIANGTFANWTNTTDFTLLAQGVQNIDVSSVGPTIDTATVTVNVQGVNDNPVAANDPTAFNSYGANENAVLNVPAAVVTGMNYAVYNSGSIGGTFATADAYRAANPANATGTVALADIVGQPGGHYGVNNSLPGIANNTENYAVYLTGFIRVATSGTYTFGTFSDDNSRIRIDLNRNGDLTDDGNVVQQPGCCGDVFGQVSLTAGDYAFEAMYTEGGGGDFGEFFYAPGNPGGWSAANYALLGDPSKGITTYSQLSGLLLNDFDYDNGDTISVDTAPIISTNGATITPNANGSFSYNPATSLAAQSLLDNQTLVDSFTYTLKDSFGGSSTAVATVTVTGVSDPVFDSYTVTEDNPGNGIDLTIATPGVRGNDALPQPYNPTLEVRTAQGTNLSGALGTLGDGSATVATAAGGQVVIQDNGSFTYDQLGKFDGLDTGETGTDTFVYTLGPVLNPGLAVSIYKSPSIVGTFATADAARGSLTPAQTGTVTQADFYGNNDSQHFPINNVFSSIANNTENYAVYVTGTLRVLTGGLYTFGIHADDNARIRIDLDQDGILEGNLNGFGGTESGPNGGTVVAETGCCADRFGTVTLAPGDYAFEAMYTEGGGGDHGEFFFAPGSFGAFDPAFKLLGDPTGQILAGTASPNSANTTVTFTINGVNDAPIANAGGPYNINIGQDLALNASGTVDVDIEPLTYKWDFDQNGTFDLTTSSPTVNASWNLLQTLTIPFGFGSHTINLVVNDGTVDSALVTTTVNVSNNFVFNPVADGVDDGWKLILNSAQDRIEIRDTPTNTLLTSAPRAGTNQVIFTGTTDDETLTIDFTNTNPIPINGVVFNAGGQQDNGDTLVLQNGAATTITHTFVTENNGSVDIDGRVVTYTGLEPITDNLSATNRVFNFTSASSEAIVLRNSLMPGFDLFINSSIGGEQVDFVKPTATLTVNLSGGGVDTLDLQTAAIAGNLSVVGTGADDVVNVSGATTLTGATAAASLTGVQTINFTGGTLAATTSVTLTASGAITTSSAVVDVAAASLLASAATGIDLDTDVADITATTSGAGNIILDEANGANVLNVAATNGDATVTSATGALNVTTVSATNVTLTATTGAITDANAAAVNVTATSLNATGATGVDLDTAINALTAASTNAAIVIRETNGLTVNTVNAGTGAVTLTLAAGAITDGNGGALNVSGGLLTLTGPGGIDLDTEATSLTAATTNAALVIREASAVAVNTLTAGTAMVTLLAGGAITDNNAAATNVTANSLLVTAVGGIALDTNIAQLAASNATTGNIAIVDADGLTVVTLGAVSGVSNTGGNVTLTTADNGAADHLTINSNVSSQTGSVTLNAGDNATIAANLSAGTTVAINIDAGNNGGATLLVNASAVITATSATFTGASLGDTFDFAPQVSTPISVLGAAPTANPGGDTLTLQTAAATNPTLNILGGQGSGLYTFGNRASVQYASIENGGATTPYHISLDATATGIDNIRLQRSNEAAIGANFEVYNNDTNVLLYGGLIGNVLSFTFLGSANANTVTIDDANGLVDLAGFVPAPTGVGDNGFVAGTPEVFLRGAGGSDTVVFSNTQDATDQIYGLGTGSAPGAQAGEVRTTNGPRVLSVYFDGVEGVVSNDASTPDTGALTIVGDANANVISLANSAGGTTVSTAGYVPFTFAPRAFSSVTVNAGDGGDTVTLVSLNALETTLAVTLNGEVGADTIAVESAPAGGTLALQGGVGNDTYNLGGAANLVDNILIPITIADTSGTDALVINDSADTSGDTVTITDSTITGLSLAPAPNVTFSAIESLDVTTTGGDDVITTTLAGTNGLVSVNVRGAGGDDDFFLNTADGMATLTTLNLIGDAGSDDFGSPTVHIKPLIGSTTNVAVYGDSTAITTNPGGSVTDRLFLDTTTTSAGSTVNPLVIVDTVTGQATAANTRLFRFGGIDDIDLYDGGVLTDVAVGDLYVRATDQDDNLIFYSEMGGVRVNHNGVVVNNALFAPTNRIVAYGRAGADYMEFNFTLGSALGADFRGEADNDTLVGGLGADTLVGGGGSDILRGGEGNDILFGEDQFLTTVANPDVQRATGVVQPGTIAGNDNLQGGGGNDVLFGGGGNDVLSGGLGDDYVHGGDGNDILDSNGGNDILRGEAGDDLINGGAGTDLILGGSGNDRMFGRAGRDFVLGGLGADQIQDDDNDNDVSVSGGLSYDADNAFTQLGASITGLNDNDLALQALMFTGGNAWNGAASFATRVGAIAGSFSGMTNDGVMDIVIGTTAAEDYLVVNAADWQLNTLDDTIATL